MSILQLKTEILEQVSKLESEKALLEIKGLLLALEQKKEVSLTESSDADVVFDKAVHEYDTVLEKLAQ